MGTCVKDDEIGFEAFCKTCDLAWVKVSYLKRFVNSGKRRTRLLPRRQELPRGSFYIGVPPAGCQKWVVSYGWASERHPCPNGTLIECLVRKLCDHGAKDDDGVFMDYTSLYQKKRKQPVGQDPQSEITK